MFKTNKNTALKVSIVGMNERALQLFTMFLEGPARGSCEVVHNGTHDVVIIDLDGVESPRLWLDVRRKFHGPVMVLSVTEKTLNNAFWVSKPVRVEHFLPVVDKVREALKNPPTTHAGAGSKPVDAAPSVAHGALHADTTRAVVPPKPEIKAHLSTEDVEQKTTTTSSAAQLMNKEMDAKSQDCCGAFQDEAYVDPRGRQALFFDPAPTLLGVFQNAMKLSAEGGMAKIEGLGVHPLFVGAGKNFASTPMPEPYLRAMCARSISSSAVSVSLVDLEPKAIGESEDPRLRRLDNMLWKVSLWSARGRVPQGTSLTDPVRLRAWPNIPRFMTVPHSMRVAALWATEPTGLLETAQKLGVPYRFVFGFYTACQSFDLVEQVISSGAVSATATAMDTSAQPVAKEKRGLFGSLLKKLGFG